MVNQVHLLIILLIFTSTQKVTSGLYLRPNQVRVEMMEMAKQAVKHVKKSGPGSDTVSDHVVGSPSSADQLLDIDLVLPYNYDIDSNANGIFDEDDQNQLKVFLTALGDLARKNGRQRFG